MEINTRDLEINIDLGKITSAIGPEGSGYLNDVIDHPPEIEDD
ncbi:hypothetical protein CCP4SC76_2650002 [Gammaproteobacteria bacterium]